MAHSNSNPVEIRAIQRSDAESITRLLESDAEGIAWTGRIPWPFTLADAHAYLDRVLPARETFAIEVQGEFAGCIGMHPAAEPETVEVGYWVGAPFRGRGVAGRALGLLLWHARQRGCRQAIASVFPGNEPSVRILTKHGFRHTGDADVDVPLRGGMRRILIYAREL